MAGVGFLILLSTIIFLKETLHPSTVKRSINPLNTLRLLLHPPIGTLTLLAGLKFGVLYSCLLLYPLVMKNTYNLDSQEIGLYFIFPGGGTVIGTIIGGKCSDISASKFKRGGRLLPTFVGSLIYAIVTLLFGWSLDNSFVFLIISGAMIGVFSTFVRPGIQTFTIEEFPNSASSVAATIIFSQFTSAFLATTFGPLLWNIGGYLKIDRKIVIHFSNHFRYFIFFLVYSIFIALASIPCLYWIITKWKKTK